MRGRRHTSHYSRAGWQDQVKIPASTQGEYIVPVTVAEYTIAAVLDTGFTDPDGEVGLALSHELYNLIESKLLHRKSLPMIVATDERRLIRSGLGYVGLGNLPQREVRILDAGSNLAGVCLLHSYPEYELIWDLSRQEMGLRTRGQRP